MRSHAKNGMKREDLWSGTYDDLGGVGTISSNEVSLLSIPFNLDFLIHSTQFIPLHFFYSLHSLHYFTTLLKRRINYRFPSNSNYTEISKIRTNRP